MEESFLLKKHGGYNIDEQANMTAEERAWLISRIDKEYKEEQKQVDKAKNKKTL